MKHLKEQNSQSLVVQEQIRERMIAANNKRALELLLRIQSQCEANTVLAVTIRKTNAP